MAPKLRSVTSRAGMSFGSAVALGILLSGCVSPEQQRQVNLVEDRNVCADMGARYGSPAHTRCMLQQQQRRDDEYTRFVQQAHLNSEIARNAQEMRDRQAD